MRKAGCIAAALTVLLTLPAGAVQTPVYDNYTYNYWGDPVEAPESYRATATVRAEDAGLKAFKEPKDIFVDTDNRVYVADTGNNRIVVLDEDFRLVREITEFKGGSSTLTLASPNGVYVKEDGTLLIADTDNKRVIEVDGEDNIVREYLRPKTDIAFSGIDFLPMKVLVDSRDFVYVLCKGLYQGAVSYDKNGDFLGYFGTNKVESTLEVIASMFWKRIMTQEQIAKMEKTVPEEFSNFDIDERGFIYTCTMLTDSQVDQIKKINPKGVNVLQPNHMIKGEFSNKYGDLEIKYYQGEMIQTRFVDVSYDPDGYINCLDFTKGRIFQYTTESNLVCIFGGTAYQQGTFSNVAAIENMGDAILVLDSGKNNITVFQPTQYLKDIHAALKSYGEGDYAAAQKLWERVIGQNLNYELAYAGIGNTYYNQGDFATAMKYFRQGYDKTGYAKALKYYRKEQLASVFPVLLTAAVAVGAVLVLFCNRRKITALFRRRRARKGGDSR